MFLFSFSKTAMKAPNEKRLDKRLIKRQEQIEELMIIKNTSVLNQLADTRADMVGLCRFINNNKVEKDYLIKEQTSKVNELSSGKHILVINDTTQLNFQSHINYLSKADKNLGPIGNDIDIGLFVHPGMVIDADTEIALGFSYMHIWNREWKQQDKQHRSYKFKPVEEKETYRWIECGLNSKTLLPSAEMITIIADRESDIYEEFARVPDKKTHLIIRAKHNRNLLEGDTLNERLENTSPTHEYELKVRTTKNRKGRETKLEVRYSKIRIKKPERRRFPVGTPQYIELNVVDVREKLNNVPHGETPINWTIITTHEVNNYQDALQITKWYSIRWQIELLFNTLKTAALNIEDSQLETGVALKKLCVIALAVALKINQLRQSITDQTEVPALIAFTPIQIEVIKILIPKYEGKTEKQKNPNKENTMKWAAWLIARLGGWKGYAKESPPGNKTFKWGLDRFKQIEIGYSLAKNMCA